ncbi:MAG TPA: hypothetical protein VIC62_08135 [Nakamurella sp.]|jgi:hypothetical protein
MTMIGADPDELDRLAAAFDHASAEARQIEWLAGSRLFLAGWLGADIDDIRFRWNNACRPGMRHCVESLQQAAHQVREQADQQRRASDAGWYYARSIGDSRGLGDILRDAWDGAINGGRSILDAIGHATGDLFVSIGDLVHDGASAAGRAVGEFGRDVAAATGLVFDKVVKPALEGDLLQLYDLAAGLPGIGELVEQTAGVVSADSEVGGVGRGLDVSQVYDNISANYGGSGHVEVQTVQGTDGQLRYVVYIPGTQAWLPGTNNPADIMSDIEVGGFYDDTPLSVAVEKAMVVAGVPDGAQVVLAGHSLGGLTAVQLSRDSDFASRYDVAGVFTAGAGTDSTPPPAGVQFYALRHVNDSVSLLGFSQPFEANRPGQHENWSIGPGGLNPVETHDMSGYQADAQALQDAGAFDGTQHALPGFFGAGSVVVDSQGFEARKLTFVGGDPRTGETPAGAGGKAA